MTANNIAIAAGKSRVNPRRSTRRAVVISAPPLLCCARPVKRMRSRRHRGLAPSVVIAMRKSGFETIVAHHIENESLKRRMSIFGKMPGELRRGGGIRSDSAFRTLSTGFDVEPFQFPIYGAGKGNLHRPTILTACSGLTG